MSAFFEIFRRWCDLAHDQKYGSHTGVGGSLGHGNVAGGVGVYTPMLDFTRTLITRPVAKICTKMSERIVPGVKDAWGWVQAQLKTAEQKETKADAKINPPESLDEEKKPIGEKKNAVG
ncbi:MAG: hypothetical protein R3C68_12130 [Myxococcota bacterium]